jgi:hypothetical protein
MSAYIERQVAMYTAILEVGAATGTFTLAHDSRTLARNIVSMEDGQGLYVLTGRDSPTQVERRILAYVSAATGQDRGAPTPPRRTTSRHSDTGQAPEGQARRGRSADGASAGSRASAGPG